MIKKPDKYKPVSDSYLTNYGLVNIKKYLAPVDPLGTEPWKPNSQNPYKAHVYVNRKVYRRM